MTCGSRDGLICAEPVPGAVTVSRRRLRAARPGRRALPRRHRRRTAPVDDATSPRQQADDRPGRRHPADPRLRLARRHPLDAGPRRPAADHPGGPAPRPHPALHPQLAVELEPELPRARCGPRRAAGDGWVKLVGDWIDRDTGDLAPCGRDDVLAEAVAAAHAAGRPGHRALLRRGRAATSDRRGIDCIEHGTGLTDDTIAAMAARAPRWCRPWSTSRPSRRSPQRAGEVSRATPATCGALHARRYDTIGPPSRRASRSTPVPTPAVASSTAGWLTRSPRCNGRAYRHAGAGGGVLGSPRLAGRSSAWRPARRRTCSSRAPTRGCDPDALREPDVADVARAGAVTTVLRDTRRGWLSSSASRRGGDLPGGLGAGAGALRGDLAARDCGHSTCPGGRWFAALLVPTVAAGVVAATGAALLAQGNLLERFAASCRCGGGCKTPAWGWLWVSWD